MRRIASHAIFWRRLYPLSYIEISSDGVFLGIHPLTEEIPATEFYDGLLLPVPADTDLPQPAGRDALQPEALTATVCTGDKIRLYRIEGEILYRCL
jgi:hypothetical protein